MPEDEERIIYEELCETDRSCTEHFSSILQRTRAAIQKSLDSRGIRLGIGSVATCVDYAYNSTKLELETVSEACGKYLVSSPDETYTTFAGTKITRDELLFLSDRMFEFGQLGSGKLCHTCGGL